MAKALETIGNVLGAAALFLIFAVMAGMIGFILYLILGGILQCFDIHIMNWLNERY